MTETDDHLGIEELATFCARQRAISLDLFEQLGASVMTTADPERQRAFATAAHRHAWHAELWAARAPSIPASDLDALTEAQRTDADLVGDYAELLDRLVDELDELRSRCDAELDPSTHRTVDLVRADLVDLRARLT